MNRYEVFEHITNKRICVLFATDYADAWNQAQCNNWHPNKYYIV